MAFNFSEGRVCPHCLKGYLTWIVVDSESKLKCEECGYDATEV